jgi:glycosyltransferase involved in cell wall biosynthesis
MKTSAKRRLLAINWEMPPLSGPRSVQVSRTLKHLVPLGWESVVVCFRPRSTRYFPDRDLAARLDPGPGVRIVGVESPEERFLFRALWRLCPPAKMLPDEKWLWMRPAARAARALASAQPFHAIASFGQPWSDHLIGRRLHRELGIPWLAHFSDPWTDSPYLRGAAWQWRVWKRMERDVAADADALVFVNVQTAERAMRKYPPDWRRKVYIVPHGYDRSMLPAAVPSADAGPLRVAYTGRFYAGRRTPEALLRAIASLRAKRRQLPLRITFAGTPDRPSLALASALGVDDLVEFRGRLSWADSMSVAMGADLLLVIDAPSNTNLFLPSKLIDYLPLRKPILGLTAAAGATADVLRALGYPIVAPDDPAAVEQALDALIASHREGRLTVSRQHDEVAARYDIRTTTAAFASALATCLSAN